MNNKPLLENIQRYVILNQKEQKKVLDIISYRKLLKNQYIVQQGNICRYDSFVVKGCSRTFYVDDEGREHIVMFATENWWTGDFGSFITQKPAYFNVQCLENTDLIQFSHEQLEELFIEVPKMERFFRLIIQEAYVALERRIIRNVSLPAKERYLKFIERHPEIDQRVPQYMIASYLGITKEFLSKIRNQLTSE